MFMYATAHCRRLGYALVCSFLALTLVTPAEAEEVTHCGQLVFGAGFLSADLDCSSAQIGPRLDRRASLDLAGFTLTGPAATFAIVCDRKCEVTGPGTIVGGANGIRGVRVTAKDLTIRESQVGVIARRIALENAVIEDTSLAGARGNKIEATDSTIADNDYEGLRARVVKLVNTVVTGNRFVGVESRGLRAEGSQITGNNVDPACGLTVVCADVSTIGRPRLQSSTCDVSLKRRACDCLAGDDLGGEADPAVNNHGVCVSD